MPAVLANLREFLLPRAAKVLPVSHDPDASQALRRRACVVRAADGGLRSGWTALTYVLRQNIIFVPLAWLLSVQFVQYTLEKFYGLMGAGESLDNSPCELCRLSDKVSFRCLPW